jgi:hypothetical protein
MQHRSIGDVTRFFFGRERWAGEHAEYVEDCFREVEILRCARVEKGRIEWLVSITSFSCSVLRI